jgi:hypothetical protein
VIDLWLHTFLDLVSTALIERISERSRYMFSPKIIVWGGMASVFGGLMWLSPVFTGKGEITLPLALLLTLGGLAALHARHGKQAGTLGWSGFILGIFGTGLLIPSFFMQDTAPGLPFDLGMPILSIGSILIGIRTLQTRILPSASGMLLFAIGVSQIGLAISVWLMDYYLAPNGIDPWNPMTIPAIATLLLLFAIGIFWIALGAILAQNPGWETSNQPPASA